MSQEFAYIINVIPTGSNCLFGARKGWRRQGFNATICISFWLPDAG
ncbi:hypothetical protein KCP70_00860 [Salmonella enterica subsp. enterica]|nr:hypothetical protein KCP70_00860 [Salmonella enterica subsp. enterica]